MHSRLRRSWCTGDTIEIPRRMLSAIVHYKEVFHGKEGVAMTDFPWRARWGQRPRNLIPHTLYKRIPIELALPMSYPFFFHAVKLRNIDAWNPTYGETLRRNWKKILKITNACSANVLTLCILWNMNFEWNLENNFFVIRKKKKSREVENLSRYWNGFFRKYTRFIGIPAIFLVF